MGEFEEALGPDMDIPDFDELVLDDKFYKEVGENREDIERNPPWSPEATDPEGYNIGFDEYIQNRNDIPNYVKTELKEAQYFGEPVILVAGFRIEELPVVRIMIDNVISKDVKLIPIRGQEMLHMRVEEVLSLPETEWEKPRPDECTTGGTWGSKRTVVFGGLPMSSQGALVEVMEESGLPPVCVTFISEKTKLMVLGELLVDAIRVQRDRKNPDKQLWDIKGRTVDDVSQLNSFMSEKIKNRMETVEKGLNSGKAKLKKKTDGTYKVEMEGLDEQIFDPEKLTSSAGKQPDSTPDQTVHHELSNKRIEDSDVQNDAILDDAETPLIESVNEEQSLEDYFAVDELVCDAFEEPKPSDIRAAKRKSQRPSFSKPVRNRNDTVSDDRGKTHHLSTPPVEIQKNVKRSTVFSGLVTDSGKFMRDNFGYSSNKGDFDSDTRSPGTGGQNCEYVEITNAAEQEAFADEIAEQEEDEEFTLEQVIQDAVNRGVDPVHLKQLIDSSSNRPALFRAKEDRPQF
eukprot:g5215.t1